LQNELSSQQTVIEELRNTISDLQNSLKEWKDTNEVQEKTIKQLQSDLEKEKERKKSNGSGSSNSNSPPLMKD